MDWINDPTVLMSILIGTVFVIGVHFDLHFRHIVKILAETNDAIKSVEDQLGRPISPEASENHLD